MRKNSKQHKTVIPCKEKYPRIEKGELEKRKFPVCLLQYECIQALKELKGNKQVLIHIYLPTLILKQLNNNL